MQFARPVTDQGDCGVPTLGGVDLRTVADCTCLRLRRTARQVTQVYDAHLAAAGLTVGQFGLLAVLFGAQRRVPGLSIKAMARMVGMDPTTLHRNLLPLQKTGLIDNVTDPRDRRARLLSLTTQGERCVADAAPHWLAAETAVKALVGDETVVALNAVLDRTGQAIAIPPRDSARVPAASPTEAPG